MPPAAMPSSVRVTIASVSSSPVRWCLRSRNSIADAGGNLGAPPKPPHSESNCRRRPRSASPRRDSVSGAADREQDRLVLAARALERLLAPWVPLDRVVGVLEKIGAGLACETVHRHRGRR